MAEGTAGTNADQLATADGDNHSFPGRRARMKFVPGKTVMYEVVRGGVYTMWVRHCEILAHHGVGVVWERPAFTRTIFCIAR